MTQLQSLFVRYPRLLRAAWFVAVLALAACQPNTDGGGNGY